MKKLLLLAFPAMMSFGANAQVVYDTVYMGAAYANQVWYSLNDDELGNAPKGNWDIAFDVSSAFSTTVIINTFQGAGSTTLWAYPGGDTAAWSTIDTNGLSTWEPRYNSDTAWYLGAMGNYTDPNSMTDVDWGQYDPNTHIITGDSLYIIKLSDGSFKKLWIKSLISGVYTFRYADLDGSANHVATITKADFPDRNFAYYSMQNNTELDREPSSLDWDLLFTQYSTMLPGYGAYTVAGVLQNNYVEVAQADNVANVATYINYAAHDFHTAINEIGYDWKSFNGTGYEIKDSLVYFVMTANTEIWKLVFTGFGGSADGSFIFSKEKLHSITGVEQVNGSAAATLSVYPNPSLGQNINLIYDLKAPVAKGGLSICDLSGRIVYTSPLDGSVGLHQHTVATASLRSGIYIVTIDTGKEMLREKLIVR